MRAAIRGRDRVTVRARKPVRLAKSGGGPGNRPFDFAIIAFNQAGKILLGDRGFAFEHLVQLIRETIWIRQVFSAGTLESSGNSSGSHFQRTSTPR